MTEVTSSNWQKCVVSCTATLREVLNAIDRGGMTIACMLNDSGRLEGIFTDSDVRHALLKGADLQSPGATWCNSHPIVAPAGANRASLAALARDRQISQIPVVDEDGTLLDVFYLFAETAVLSKLGNAVAAPGEGPRPRSLPNSMFILAGGLGMRLRAAVSDRPKPLALVGEQPILATVIQQAVRAGIDHFYVSVNHQAEMIEAHLKDAAYSNLNIRIIREPRRLGTAGSIALVASELKHALVVCNADVLTTAPLDRLIAAHERERSSVTVAVRPHQVTVPFGVTDIRDNAIKSIQEKPTYTYLVNAGIYVVNAAACQSIEAGKALDMPDLIASELSKGNKVSPFFLHEYWIDIGQPEEYKKANEDFAQIFGDGGA